MNGNNMIILGCHDREEFSKNCMNINGHKETRTNPNSYRSLCENSIEICEFCDKVSKNRYSSIIHTGSHIIIPLLNQKVYQCIECLHHFTSINNLKHHISLKHRIITKSETNLVKNDSIVVDNYEPITKIDSKTKNHDLKNENHDSKIKNRLLFEEDLTESDVVLMDLTTECQVNIELFKTPWFGTNQEFADKTVRYDELMRPGLYKCRKCCEMFPNRFQSIIHEARHLSLRNCEIQQCRICNRYIDGDANALRQHHTQTHKPKPNCPKCGASCEDVQKHKIYCPMNTFDYYDNKNEYKMNSKIINLCEMCYSFCRSTQLKQYACIGVECEIGKRFPCEGCGSLFFEVKQVERRIWYREKEKDERKRKALSNEHRLKNIQQRIKMLK